MPRTSENHNLLSERDVREFSPPPRYALSAPSEPEPNDEQRAAKRRKLAIIANNFLRGEPPVMITALLKGPFDITLPAQTRSDSSSPSQSTLRSKRWRNPWRARKYPGIGPAQAAEIKSQHVRNLEEQKSKEDFARQQRAQRLNRAAELTQDRLGIGKDFPVDSTVGDIASDTELDAQHANNVTIGAEQQSAWLSRRQSTKLSVEHGHDNSQESAFVQSPIATRKTQLERLQNQTEHRKRARTGRKDGKVQTSLAASITKPIVSPKTIKPIPRPSNAGARILSRNSDGPLEALTSKQSRALTYRKPATTGRKNEVLEARAMKDSKENDVSRRGRKSPRRMMFDTPLLHKRPDLDARALVPDTKRVEEVATSSRHIEVPGRPTEGVDGYTKVGTAFAKELPVPRTSALHTISSPVQLQQPDPIEPNIAPSEVQVPSTAPHSTLPHRPTPSDSNGGRASRSTAQHAQELEPINISHDIDTQAIAAGVDDAFDDLFDVTEPDLQLPEEQPIVADAPNGSVSRPSNAMTPFKDFHLRDSVPPPLDTQAMVDAVWSPFAQSTVKKARPKRVTLSEMPANTPAPSLRGISAADLISGQKEVLERATGNTSASNIAASAQDPPQHAHQRSFEDFTPLDSSAESNPRASNPMTFASPRIRARRLTYEEGQELLNRNSFPLSQSADVVGSFLESWQMDSTPTSLPRTSQRIASQRIASAHSGWRPINSTRRSG